MGVCCLAFTLRSLQSSKNVTWAIEVSNNISSTLSTPSCLLLLLPFFFSLRETEIHGNIWRCNASGAKVLITFRDVTNCHICHKKVDISHQKRMTSSCILLLFFKKNCCWKIVTFEAVKPCQKITSKTVPPLVPECQLCSQIESRKKEIQNNEVWICILNPYW